MQSVSGVTSNGLPISSNSQAASNASAAALAHSYAVMQQQQAAKPPPRGSEITGAVPLSRASAGGSGSGSGSGGMASAVAAASTHTTRPLLGAGVNINFGVRDPPTALDLATIWAREQELQIETGKDCTPLTAISLLLAYPFLSTHRIAVVSC